MSTVTMIGTLASKARAERDIAFMRRIEFGALRDLQASQPVATEALAAAQKARRDLTWYAASLAGNIDLDRVYAISDEIASSRFSDLVRLVENDDELVEIAMLFLDLSSTAIARTCEFDSIQTMLTAIAQRTSAGAPLGSELYVHRRRGLRDQ